MILSDDSVFQATNNALISYIARSYGYQAESTEKIGSIVVPLEILCQCGYSKVHQILGSVEDLGHVQIRRMRFASTIHE